MRNDIFGILRAAQVDPDNCEISDVSFPGGGAQATVTHKPSGSKTEIWRDHDDSQLFLARMTIGQAYFADHGPVGWTTILVALGQWGQEADYEATTPDLWSQLKELPVILSAGSYDESSNNPFTPDERVEIAAQLDQVLRQLEAQGKLLPGLKEAVEEAKKATGRMVRKDWVMLFVGQVVSTAWTAAVPPDVIRHALIVVLTGIGHMFGVGGPPSVITA